MTTPKVWVFPKGSGIRLRSVQNQTTIGGERRVFRESVVVTVPARLRGSGKGRLRQQFGSRADAEAFAREQYAGTKVLGEQFFELTAPERRDAVAALDLLRPLKLSLLAMATEYAKAHAKLAGRPLLEAVEYFGKRNPVGMPAKTVIEVLVEMLDAKRSDGASAVYLKDLEIRCGKFADAFPGRIGDVTAPALNEWLRKLDCEPRTRNNTRRAIKTLFSFAQAHDYIAKDHVDFSKVAKAREGENVIEVFTPAEMRKLLAAATAHPADLPVGFNLRYIGGLLPLLLLGGFAGLRTAEISRQRWEDINLERGFIRVSAGKGGTAQKRLVPILPNLSAWLAPLRRESGLVLDVARTPDAIRRLAERAGVEWKHNALRHSFISYRVAQSQNVAQTSLEAGNSPQMIHRHYRELVAPSEASEWFGIVPAAPPNVVPLKKAAGA